MRIYDFRKVVGNVSTITVLQHSLRNNTFPHIAMFSGMHGTGKSTSAEIAALYLTCESPSNGNPCLQCRRCRNNLNALQSTGTSGVISKINVAQLDKKEMEQTIKDMFQLQNAQGNCVYVLEEAHVLTDNEQTALLEEIDRVSSNTYIIFCTTRPTRLLKELRSRAINFQFNRLTAAEASVLLEFICSDRNIDIKDNSVKEMILSSAKGIPRNIVNLIEFICSNQFETQTIAEFLGLIDEDFFILLFESMRSPDIYNFVNVLDDLLGKNSSDVFVEQLKEFVLRVLFLIEGAITEGLAGDEVERIRNTFNGCDVTKIATIVESIKYNALESEIKFKLLKVRQILQNRTISDVLVNKKVEAATQKERARVLHKTQDALEQQSEVKLEQLDMQYLSSFSEF